MLAEDLVNFIGKEVDVEVERDLRVFKFYGVLKKGSDGFSLQNDSAMVSLVPDEVRRVSLRKKKGDVF